MIICRLYYYVSYNLVWKDEEDNEHKLECASYSSFESAINDIKNEFKYSYYQYTFNIHYEKDHPFQNRVCGYLECLIDKTFVLSKVNRIQIKNNEKTNSRSSGNYRNYR